MRVAAVVVAMVLAVGAAAQPPVDPDLAGVSGSTLRLFKAVVLNDITAVKGALEDGASLDKANANGMTAADFAVDLGHFIIAHYLLSRKLLGETPPVLLTPGKVPEAAKIATVKPTFAKPPSKPSPPQAPGAPAAAPEVAEAPVTTEPPTDIPEQIILLPPSPTAEKAGEKAGDVVAETPAAPAVAPTPPADLPPADKPLGDLGVAKFFKSLVDLITPGGEKPPAMAAAKPAKVAEPAPATPGATAPPEIPGEQPAAPAAQPEPPEIVVDITGDGPPAGELLEEIKEPPLPALEDKDLETLTADTPPAAKDAAPKEAPMPAEMAAPKPDDGPPSVLDRLADLLQPDAKTAEPAAAPTPEVPAAPPAPSPPAPAAAAPAPPGGPQPATPGAVTAYELPLPAPKPSAPGRFSPRFLDKLADFLESGDEAAFKAWLPEMQIMGADAPIAPQAPPTVAAPAEPVAPTPATPPATEMAAKPETQPAAKAEVAMTAAAPEAPPAADPGMSASDALEADLAGIAGEAPPPAIAVAESAPARPPDAGAGKPGMIRGAFDKLLGALTPTGRDIGASERLVLEPEEKLAAAGPGAPRAAPADKAWPVTDVEAAETPPLAPMRPVSDMMMKTSLTGVTLSLGESVSLENSYPPSQDGIDPQNECVKKNRGTTLFCLEPIDWPERMQADFLVPTILYTGHKAIARYDQGIASRLHALFPSASFERVVGYFRDRFGEPTDVWNRSIAPFAQPRQDNPTLAWRSVDPKTGAVSVLEIRKYDDSRGGFPDTNRGAAMLYLANSPPIFPQVSAHELMRLSRTRMGPPSDQAAAAQTPTPTVPGAAPPGTEPYALPAPGAPDLALPPPGEEPPDLALPPPGAAMTPAGEEQPADQPAAEPGAPSGAPSGAEGKTEKQIRDEERAKRRAEREAKRAAGAAKLAREKAKEAIGAKRAAPATKKAAPKPAADDSLDLPPDPIKR